MDEVNGDFNSFDEEMDESTAYCLDERDWLIVEAAKTMLWKEESPSAKLV